MEENESAYMAELHRVKTSKQSGTVRADIVYGWFYAEPSEGHSFLFWGAYPRQSPRASVIATSPVVETIKTEYGFRIRTLNSTYSLIINDHEFIH